MEDFTFENKNDKQTLWEEGIKKCETITDGLGLAMDENIKESVVGLWMNGFNTAGSCGGHIEEFEGKTRVKFPYVYIKEANQPKYRFDGEKEVTEKILANHHLSRTNDIFDGGVIEKEYDDAMESIYENNEVEEFEDWSKLDKKLQEKVLMLIEEYNAYRKTQSLKPSHLFPGIRIQYAVQEETVSELEKAQKEFDLFAEYLKNGYFNQQP